MLQVLAYSPFGQRQRSWDYNDYLTYRTRSAALSCIVTFFLIVRLLSRIDWMYCAYLTVNRRCAIFFFLVFLPKIGLGFTTSQWTDITICNQWVDFKNFFIKKRAKDNLSSLMDVSFLVVRLRNRVDLGFQWVLCL